MRSAFTDAMADHRPQPRLLRIDPFEAFNHDGVPVRVVGLTHDGDDLDFICLKSIDGDEILPTIESSVYKSGIENNA